MSVVTLANSAAIEVLEKLKRREKKKQLIGDFLPLDYFEGWIIQYCGTVDQVRDTIHTFHRGKITRCESTSSGLNIEIERMSELCDGGWELREGTEIITVPARSQAIRTPDAGLIIFKASNWGIYAMIAPPLM